MFLEVQFARTPDRFGFELDDLEDAYNAISILPHIQVRGLMTVAPPGLEPNWRAGERRALSRGRTGRRSVGQRGARQQVDLLGCRLGRGRNEVPDDAAAVGAHVRHLDHARRQPVDLDRLDEAVR